MYICTYIHTNIHTHKHFHIYTCIHTITCIHAYKYKYFHIFKHAYVHIYIYIYEHLYTNTHVYICMSSFLDVELNVDGWILGRWIAWSELRGLKCLCSWKQQRYKLSCLNIAQPKAMHPGRYMFKQWINVHIIILHYTSGAKSMASAYLHTHNLSAAPARALRTYTAVPFGWLAWRTRSGSPHSDQICLRAKRPASPDQSKRL